jgi:hypothetical protein
MVYHWDANSESLNPDPWAAVTLGGAAPAELAATTPVSPTVAAAVMASAAALGACLRRRPTLSTVR